MPNKKHKVQLLEAERKKLIAIVSKGQNKAVVIRRAHILLKVDEGKTDAEISQLLYVSEQTIRRICGHRQLSAMYLAHQKLAEFVTMLAKIYFWKLSWILHLENYIPQ
jgi:hypothetical protein